MSATLTRPDAPPLHIVLVTDGSPDSDAAVELINALPLPAGSEITVLTGADPQAAEAPRAAVLQRAAALMQRDGLTVTSHVAPEITAPYLREHTLARLPDLVVLGTEGPADTMADWLRAAFNPLVEQLSMPVLVARAPFRGLRRILLAYDGSPDSRAAVSYLTRLPLPAGCVVTVLNVHTDVPSIEAVPASGPQAPRLVHSLSDLEVRDEPTSVEMHVANTKAAQAVEVLTQAGIDAHGRVRWGDAATAILHKAALIDADLLVAGSRGLSGVWSWLLGSVTRQLVRDRRWPVLIVRGEVPGDPAPPGA